MKLKSNPLQIAESPDLPLGWALPTSLVSDIHLKVEPAEQGRCIVTQKSPGHCAVNCPPLRI